jgi:two-component system, OmpR family, phosphate regulon sensor histidine kinase PhoR
MVEDGRNPLHYNRRVLLALIASGLAAGISMLSGYLALATVAAAIVGFCAGRIRHFSSAAPAVVADSIESILQQGSRDEALLLAEILEAVDLPTLAISADGIVLIVNSLAGHLLPSLVPGVPLAFGIRDPDVLNALEKTHEFGIRQMVEWSEPAHLRRTFRIRIAPLVHSSSSACKSQIEIITLEDLSEQRVVERTRVDFVANASHELRTPLAAMLGFIETLQGPARSDSDARDRFLAIMREQGLRMSRLIDDLLSLSRIEQRAHQAPEELVDLSLVVREIVDTLMLVAHERGVILVIKSAGANVTTRGDRDELLRLAENLIENAIKYGDSGGRVEINVHAEDGEATLTVRDYGPGIAPEHIPRLTERFYRVDVGKSRNSGGTGLGLALVKHIVLRHRGSLFIESPSGGGALFRAVFRHFTP